MKINKENILLFSKLVAEFNKRIKYCLDLIDEFISQTDERKLNESETLLSVMLFDYVCVLR
jgi:hypothetical protein